MAASAFEEFRRDRDGRHVAVGAIHDLLRLTPAPYVILSNSSGGRATASELHHCITDVGRVVEVMEVDYRRNVMAGMRWTRDWVREAEAPNREYLFLIEKK